MPRLYSFVVFYESIFYSMVTQGSLVTFLLLLTFIERNILNMISFLLLLVMLMINLLKGTETMIKYYRIIPLYQAYVLLSLIVCQFVTSCLIIYPSVFFWIINLNNQNRFIFWFFGYYQYSFQASFF